MDDVHQSTPYCLNYPLTISGYSQFDIIFTQNTLALIKLIGSSSKSWILSSFLTNSQIEKRLTQRQQSRFIKMIQPFICLKQFVFIRFAQTLQFQLYKLRISLSYFFLFNPIIFLSFPNNLDFFLKLKFLLFYFCPSFNLLQLINNLSFIVKGFNLFLYFYLLLCLLLFQVRHFNCFMVRVCLCLQLSDILLCRSLIWKFVERQILIL